MFMAKLMLLLKERDRFFKAIFYQDLYTGKSFGLIRAARYVLKNPGSYDREWEAAMYKAAEHRDHIKNKDILNKLIRRIE